MAKKRSGIPTPWVVGGALGIALVIVLVVRAIVRNPGWPWEAVLAVLVLGVGVLGAWLGLKGGWVEALRDRLPKVRGPESAVVRVGDGREAVGCAVRTGSRHLVTVPSVVNRALHREEADSAPPLPGVQVELAFDTVACAGGDRRAMATVAVWGPSRPLRPNVVVLHTVKRLPARVLVPRLKPDRRPHSGKGRIIFPRAVADTDAGVEGAGSGGSVGEISDSEVAGMDLDLLDRALVVRHDLPPNAAGAPVLSMPSSLAAGPGSDGPLPGNLLGLLASDGATRDDDQCRQRLVPLADADEVRAVLRPVRRRTVLRYAAGTAVVLAGGGTVAWIVRDPPPAPLDPPPAQLKGYGWHDLFSDPEVQEYLLKKSNLDATNTKKLSGVASLSLTPGDLQKKAFVTCPNLAIANKLRKIASKALRRQISTPIRICTEPMVLLVHNHTRQALMETSLLVGVDDEKQPRFDLQTYLRGYSRARTWKSADPGFRGQLPGRPIKIDYSDPAQTGGGLVYLAVLDYVQRDLKGEGGAHRPPGEHLRLEWLLGPDGPLSATGAPATSELTRRFASGIQEMVFTYEHDAIRFLRKQEGISGKHIVLHMSPDVKVSQYYLPLTDEGERLGELLAEDQDFAKILSRCLDIRAPGMGAYVDGELATTELRRAMWEITGDEQINREGLKPVDFNVDRMEYLLKKSKDAQRTPL